MEVSKEGHDVASLSKPVLGGGFIYIMENTDTFAVGSAPNLRHKGADGVSVAAAYLGFSGFSRLVYSSC